MIEDNKMPFVETIYTSIKHSKLPALHRCQSKQFMMFDLFIESPRDIIYIYVHDTKQPIFFPQHSIIKLKLLKQLN